MGRQVFPNRLINSARISVLVGLITSGCATYPERSAQVKRDFVRADYEGALAAIDPGDCAGGRNQLLCLLERATIKQNLGDFQGSNQDFEAAYQLLRDYEDRPVISARDALSGTEAFLVNEAALPYKGQGVEKMLIHIYMALNYLMLGDLEGARVEMRRFDQRRQREKEAHARRLEEAEESSRKHSLPPARISEIEGVVLKAYGSSGKAAGSVADLYLSALGSYLSGLVYDMEGEYPEALIDCRRVISQIPSFECARIDAFSLGADDVALPPLQLDLNLRGDMVIIYHCGLSPVKREVSIPIPTGRGWLAVAFPVYGTIPTALDRAVVYIDGKEAGVTGVLSDVEAKQIRNLMDQVPVMVIRQMVRVALKAVALRAASKESRWGEFLLSMYNILSERADLRSWLLLPKNIQVLRLYPPLGRRTVRIALIDSAGRILGETSREMEFKNDQVVLVNLRAVGYTPLLPASLTINDRWQTLPRVPLSERPRTFIGKK